MDKFDDIRKLKVRACFGTWTNGQTAVEIKECKLKDHYVTLSYKNRGEYYPKTYDISYPAFFEDFIPNTLIEGKFQHRVVDHPQIIEALKNEPKTTTQLLEDLVKSMKDEKPVNRRDEDGFIHLF